MGAEGKIKHNCAFSSLNPQNNLHFSIPLLICLQVIHIRASASWCKTADCIKYIFFFNLHMMMTTCTAKFYC
jgi:hypothetical protein